jgi:SNF2 family DNA or RNA helicase
MGDLVLSTSASALRVAVHARLACALRDDQRECLGRIFAILTAIPLPGSTGGGAVLHADVGTGKTVHAIALLSALFGKIGDDEDDCFASQVNLFRDPHGWIDVRGPTPAQLFRQARRLDGPALVIAPASLATHWQQELRKWGTFTVRLLKDSADLDGRARDAYEVLITSPEKLTRNITLLCRARWSLVIIDEVHTVSNPTTKENRAIRAARGCAQYVLGLTATPIKNAVCQVGNWCDSQF